MYFNFGGLWTENRGAPKTRKPTTTDPTPHSRPSESISVNCLLIFQVFPKKWSVNGLFIAKKEFHTELPRTDRKKTSFSECPQTMSVSRMRCPCSTCRSLFVKMFCSFADNSLQEGGKRTPTLTISALHQRGKNLAARRGSCKSVFLLDSGLFFPRKEGKLNSELWFA